MAQFKPYKITSSQLDDLEKSEGQFIVTTDTQKIYLDEDALNRIELGGSDVPEMTILSYGSSTWNDFLTAYGTNSVVYCRASSNSNPATGSQNRLAFMAYVNNQTNPTEVEFQYYRSVATHTDNQQGDQVYVYKLNSTNGGTWSVTIREAYTKVKAGTGLTSSYNNGTITLNSASGTVTKVSAGTGLTTGETSPDITTTGTLSLDTSGVTAGTYQGLTVDSYGRITAASDQGYTTNTGTITGITMNGTSKGTSGVVDLGTVLTSYTETDPIYSASAASGITSSDITNWNNKTSNTGTITGVSVNGTSIATSGVANITSVPASILTGAIPSGVTATTQSQGDNSTKIATTAYVDTAIENLPDPMVFKGSLGTNGTITALPVDGSANIGDTYKVITAGTYASKTAQVGDTFICLTKTSNANTWELIPSGDEPSGTVTSVTIKGSGAIAVDSEAAITSSGTRTISHTDSGVTAGTYTSVTVDAKGHVTAGSNPSEINSNLVNGSATGSLRGINTSVEYNSYTMGDNAFAEGHWTTASGTASHAEGESTWATGNYSHAEGYHTSVSGSYAHAEGNETRATNAGAHAEGQDVYASSAYQHAQGKHNIIDSESVYADIIGNGTSESARSNAATVDWNGNAWYAGDVYVGSTSGTNKDSGSVKLAKTSELRAAGTGLSLSGTTLNHSNSVTAGTAGTSSATSGSTLAVPYVTYDAQGHITASGTHTHTITGFATSDTKNTAGSTDTSSKIYLIGATEQSENPQTYSQDTAYVGTDGKLYSNSKEVVNLSDSQALTNKTYNGYTLAAASAKDVDTSISASSTSTKLPTSQAVASFVEGKGYTTNTGTVTSVATGAGLTGGTISTSGTIKANLKSETKSTLAAADMGSTADRQYAVGIDKNDKLSVNIPWTDNNTTYTFATGDSNGQIKVTPSGGSAQNITVKNINNAAYKDVDTSISAASTSTKLPTSQAVASFVEGKGYTTNTGTITGVSVDGTSIATSGVANITSIPTDILTPMMSKTYTGIQGSGDNNSTNYAFYYMSVRPDDFNKPWSIRYRIRVWIPDQTNFDAWSDSYFIGEQANINSYASFNHFYSTSYRPVYYQGVNRLKSAGYTAGYGHAFAMNMADSHERATSGYARSFTVEILSAVNCTPTLLDTPVLWANWTGTGSTNYNDITNYNFSSNGLQESGDSDTTYQLRSYYDRPLIGTTSLYGYSICSLTTDDKLQGFVTSYGTGTSKTKNNVTFKIGAPFWYYGSSTEKTTGTYPADNTLYYQTSSIDLRYSTNCGTALTTNKPVYLVGIPNGSTYTLADTWWTQTLPTSDDGKIYIYLGIPYSSYQLAWQIEHPIYWYKNGALQLYTNSNIPASLLNGAIANGVTATTQSANDNSTKIATTAYVDGAIANLPEPMLFKGSLGTGGTITSLPTAASSNEGYVYKVITEGTYQSISAKVGDTFISTGSEWVLIPSGDEPAGTVTSVTIKATSPIAIDSNSAITSSGTRTLSHANSGVTAGTYKSVTVNETGHVTAGTNPTSLSGYGITDAKIDSGVITLGNNTITPLTSSSTLDATKLSGTIPSGCYTNTKNTAGTTNTTSKIYLAGATEQSANPQTYSNINCYASGGKLYSNAKEVVNLSDTQTLTNKTYNGLTLTAATTGFTIAGGTTSKTLTVGNNYTLGAACEKAVVTTIDTSASLPTSNAVKTFVEGKGYVTTDTKNTAGSTDTSSKIYLIGATSQAANPQTYSDNEVYVTSGVLTTKSVQVGGTSATMQYNSTDKCIEFVFA